MYWPDRRTEDSNCDPGDMPGAYRTSISESLKVYLWPVGQVVKTEASHAFNIGSNPVRVTISFLTKSAKVNILQFVTANHGFNSWC